MKKMKEIQNKKLNTRLYPIYKAISWDLLFYFSIIYLFLTQTKGFSPSQVLVTEAFFMASCLLLQIPSGLLIDKFGKKNSVVFANICICIFTLILIIVNKYIVLLIGYFIYAIGYVIKGICETNILYDCLPRGKKRGGLYSKIDGRATSSYYIIDAITSLITGFAFVINPYLPICLSLIASIISTILSTQFKHIYKKEKNEIIMNGKEYLNQLKEATRFAFNSKRLLSLLIFFGLIGSLNYNLTTFRSGILNQVKLPEQYFGMVFAMVQVAASLCAGLQDTLHKKFRNKTLSFIGLPMTIFYILIGLFATKSNTFIIISLFVMLGGIKGAYNVLTYRYLNNFTNKEIRTKLATIRNIIYNLFTITISLVGAGLLNVTNASNTMIILGIISTIVLLALLYYMKDKVGLKPEEYSNYDLKYSHFKIKEKGRGNINESKTRV